MQTSGTTAASDEDGEGVSKGGLTKLLGSMANCFTLDSLFKGHGNSGQVILNLIFAGSLTGIFVFKY